MTDDNESVYTYCNECNQEFPDSFQLIDHFLEEDEEFDPYLILPNGIKLLMGSFLRYIFDNVEDTDKIKLLVQSTYVTLFAAENGFDQLNGLIEDMVIDLELQDFDKNLQAFLEKETDDDQGGA